MKKVFSVFMIFFAVFLVSCGGLLEEEPRNTVRITMPGNGRAVSASGASDVDYYNIQIASQSFSNVSPGTTVESMQLPVGMSISISVEAIGDLKENGNVVDSGRRIAYYQTSERLPAEGLTLNVNMANYKMEYHKVTLEADRFDRVAEEVYVADGSSYTLPNYGTYTPSAGSSANVPLKHTGWRNTVQQQFPVGTSVIVTGDLTYNLVAEDFVHVIFMDNTGCFANGDQNVEWKSEDYVARGETYTLPSYGIGSFDTFAARHTGWTASQNNMVYSPGQTVTITDDMIDQADWAVEFTVKTDDAVELQIGSAHDIILPADGSVFQPTGSSLYFIWQNKSFTLPRAKKDDDDTDVVTWELTGTAPSGITKNAGAVVTHDEWSNVASTGTLYISPQ